MAAGSCPVAEQVFDRILRIPTLPWMRGTLVLIHLDALDLWGRDFAALAELGTVDRTVMLPWSSGDAPDERAMRQTYHQVLRVCADLGMIAGRGVARAG